MKRFIICALLVVAFCLSNDVQAQFKNTELAWGLSLGGAQGSNSPEDKWVLQFRGFLQIPIFSPTLMGQVGLGYVPLTAPDMAPGSGAGVASGEALGYSAETILADFRLLFSPLTLTNFDPYIYAGLGVSKNMSNIGGLLAMVPFGVGMQTKISPGVLLLFNIGYNLSLSDEMDGRNRSETYSNDFTGGKHDGFYGFSLGAAFTLGKGDGASEEAKKKELAEAQARLVKMQADAEAKRVKELADAEARKLKQQTSTEAEAQRLKQQAEADAEARRVKALADAEAQRVKQQADAEARRVKELADAEARRLAAEQKKPDTLIILEKGKRVVLRGVNFETNKATLTRYSENILWRAYNAMVANPNVQVVITGHTDNVGSDKANQVLSLKRAQAVKNWLVQKGIASNRMRTVGKGESEPVASNETNEGRLENRRIEFYTEK